MAAKWEGFSGICIQTFPKIRCEMLDTMCCNLHRKLQKCRLVMKDTQGGQGKDRKPHHGSFGVCVPPTPSPGIKPGATHMLGKCSPAETPPPQVSFYLQQGLSKYSVLSSLLSPRGLWICDPSASHWTRLFYGILTQVTVLPTLKKINKNPKCN